MEILFEMFFLLVLHIEVGGQGQNSSTATVWDSLACCSSHAVRIKMIIHISQG